MTLQEMITVQWGVR